jgi:hypothetical protein
MELSSSVRTVVEEFRKVDEGGVTASDIVRRLLYHHGEYGGGMAKNIRLRDVTASDTRSSLEDWIRAVQSQYDSTKVSMLDGRLMILGLTRIVPDLEEQLSVEFIGRLKRELKEPFDSLLLGQAKGRGDTVPSHVDRPSEVDQLGRQAFAQALALRLRRVRADLDKTGDRTSFLLHIHGPWGAGKTSLLNLLRRELRGEPARWVVIDFNAWQHQRLGSPWWWLMNSVFRQGAQQLSKPYRWRSVNLRIHEYWWRMKTGWTPYIITLALLAWGVTVLIELSTGGPARFKATDFSAIGTNAKHVAAVITLLTTLWGLGLGFSRWLVLGSARAGNVFMESTRDPMESLSRHFNDILRWIKEPVCIFIDDLDRCQAGYVVDLLEGIQTLFREAPVTYVVAADRRWLFASYEKAYDIFVTSVLEPGRPLGYLFLEKTFQLSTSVPRMSLAAQEGYWHYLIRVGQQEVEAKLSKARAEAKERLQRLQTEEEILEEVRLNSGDRIQRQALREAAVVRLARADVDAWTEHTLKPFAPLLEPNPRAMKRLVNAYGIQRAIATLSEEEIPREQLALWTIVSLRWPILADYLENHPDMVRQVGKSTVVDSIPQNLRALFQDDTVTMVIRDNEITPLDEKAIRSCASLRTSDSSARVTA